MAALRQNRLSRGSRQLGATVLTQAVAVIVVVIAARDAFMSAGKLVSRRAARTERGASLVEYALLVGLIAIVCIGAVTVLGSNSSSKFSKVGSAIGS